MAEDKPKKVLTDEQKLKMKEGRERKLAEKGGKKDKAPKPEKTPKESISVDEKLDAVLGGINTLAGAVSKLVEIQTSARTEVNKTTDDTKVVGDAPFHPSMDDETYPKAYIPRDWRKIVDDILSPEFGITVEDFPDRSDFLFSVIVPTQYSSVSPADQERGVQDIRSRMIPRALGVNGIKEWCTLIRTNLNRFYVKEGVQSPFKSMA